MRLKSEGRFAVDPRLTLVFGLLDLVLDPRFLDPRYGPSFVNFVSRYSFFFFGEGRVVSPLPRRNFVFCLGGAHLHFPSCVQIYLLVVRL